MNDSNRKPYKQTPETVKIIVDAISSGLTQRDASALAGISEDTLCLWKRANSDFSEQVRCAEVHFKLKHMKNIEKASDRDWKASAWLLERKFKQEFTLSPKHEKPLVSDFPAFEFNQQAIVDRVMDSL